MPIAHVRNGLNAAFRPYSRCFRFTLSNRHYRRCRHVSKGRKADMTRKSDKVVNDQISLQLEVFCRTSGLRPFRQARRIHHHPARKLLAAPHAQGPAVAMTRMRAQDSGRRGLCLQRAAAAPRSQLEDLDRVDRFRWSAQRNLGFSRPDAFRLRFVKDEVRSDSRCTTYNGSPLLVVDTGTYPRCLPTGDYFPNAKDETSADTEAGGGPG
jgi:hypothetical protein